MGQRGMGTLLELGPEGDMGSCDLALLYLVHTSEDYGKSLAEDLMSSADLLVHVPADVLVGCELSPVSPGQHSCL